MNNQRNFISIRLHALRKILRASIAFIIFLFTKGKLSVVQKTSIYDIDYDALASQGIRLLIFDLDDTLTNRTGTISEKSLALMRKWKRRWTTYNISILTNASTRRKKTTERLLSPNNIPVFNDPPKPAPDGYMNAMREFSTPPRHTTAIGDRVLTDIWGARLAGIESTILVKPYSELFGGKKHFLIIRILRVLERKFLIA